MHEVPMMAPVISFNGLVIVAAIAFGISSDLDLPAGGFDPLASQRVDGYVFNYASAAAGDDGKR